MGFKLTANTLTEQNAVLNTTVSQYKKDKEYYDSIYEMLHFREEMDIARINEACENYKFLMLASLNEVDSAAVIERLKSVWQYVCNFVDKAIDVLMLRYGNKTKLMTQIAALESDVGRLSSMGNFKVSAPMIIIKNPTAAVNECFANELGQLKNIGEEMKELEAGNCPSSSAIDKKIETLNKIKASEGSNASLAGRVYDKIGVEINGKDFMRETVLFTKNSAATIVKTRMALLKAITVQFEKALATARVQKKKAENIMNRIEKKNAPTENMIRYMNYMRDNVTHTYTLLTASGAKLSAFCDMNVKNLRYAMDMILGYREKNEATIHGEDFDSDALFDTLSDEDFNPTEWMDLTLAEGFYDFNRVLREVYRDAYLQECMMYLSESGPSVTRLEQINEANSKGLQNAFEMIHKAMQAIIEKWGTTAINFANTDKGYLIKYATTILDTSKPIENLDDSTTGGYIFAGLDAINNFKYPNFDYNGSNGDIYKDVNTCLQKLVDGNTFINNKNVQRNEFDDPREFIKAYFGFKYKKGGNDSDNTIKLSLANDINPHLKSMYNTLLTPAPIINAINRDFEDIKKKANAKDNAVPNQNPAQAQQQNSGDSNGTNNNTDAAKSTNMAAKQEGTYSFVQDRYILEFEANKAVNQNDTNNTQAPNNTNNPPDAGKTSDVSSFNACKKVYIQAMYEIMKTQLSAFEYIRNEYRQIIFAKVEAIHPEAANERKQPKKGNA